MSVTFIASAQAANAGTADVSLTVPAGVTTSHLGVITVATSDAATAAMTVPTGWTARVNKVAGQTGTLYIFTRLGGVSAGQKITLTIPASAGATSSGAWYDTQGRDIAQASAEWDTAAADVTTVTFKAPGQAAATDVILVAATRTAVANSLPAPAGVTRDFYGVDSSWICGAFFGHANGVTSQQYVATWSPAAATSHNTAAMQFALAAPSGGGGTSSPTFVGTTQYGDAVTSNVATATIPIPAGAQAGDAMIAAVEIQLNTTTISSAPGWTTLSGPDSPSGTMNAWVLGRMLSAADISAGSVSVTVTVAGRLVVLAHTYRGVTITGARVASQGDASSTSNPVLPSDVGIPAGSAGSVFFVRRRSGTAGTVTVPSPYTTAGTTASNNGTGTNVYIDGGYELNEPSTEGGQTGTSGVSSVGVNYLVSLPLASQNYTPSAADIEPVSDYPVVTGSMIKASVGATTVTEVATSTSSMTLPTPAGTQPGDLLVASFNLYSIEHWDVTDFVAPSADWKLVAFASDDYYGPVTAAFILPVTGTPAASYTFGTASGAALTGMLTRVMNADLVNPLAQPPLMLDMGVTQYGPSVTLPDEQIVGSNVLTLTVASMATTGTTLTMVPPAGQTQQAANSGVGARTTLTSEFVASPAQLGQDTWTSTSSNNIWAFLRLYLNTAGASVPPYQTPAIASTSIAESAAENVTSLVVPTPAGAQVGDVLLLHTQQSWPHDITAPAGQWYRAGVHQTLDKQTIAIDSSGGPAGTTGATTGTSTSWTHTVNAGARNRVLAVGVTIGSTTTTADTTVTVTVNGTSISGYGALHVNSASVNGNFAQLFVMISPPTGPLNIVVTTSTSVTINAGSVCYTGVDITNPYGQAVGISAGSSASSINTDSGTTPGNYIIALLASQQKVTAVSSPWTTNWSRAGNTTMLGGNGAMVSMPVTASSTSVTWTFAAASASGGIMAELNPAPTTTTHSVWWTQLTSAPPASYTVGVGDTPSTAILSRVTGAVPNSPIELPVREDWSTGKYAGLDATGDRSSFEANTLHVVSVATTDTGSMTFTGQPPDLTKVAENTGVGKKLTLFTRQQPAAGAAMPTPDSYTVSDAAGVYWTLLYAPLRPSVLYKQAYTPSAADPVGITDTTTTAAGNTRSAADTVGLTDAVTISITRSVADTVGITDIGSGGAIYAPIPADTVGATDATAITKSQTTATGPDTVGITDTATPGWAYGPAAADTVGSTDAITAVKTKFATTSDGDVGISDIGSMGIIYAPTPQDQVDGTDATSFVQTQAPTVPDQVGLTDAVTVVKTQTLTLADTVGVTDAAAKGFGRTSADSVGITDTATKVSGYAPAPADTVGVTDAIAHVSADVIADPVGITDAWTKTYIFGAFPQDTVGLTDAITIKQTNARTTAETIGITDAEAVYGVFALPVTTTAEPDVETKVSLNDVVSLHGTAAVTVDFPVADLEKGPQRATIDIEAKTSDLTHVVALSGTAAVNTGFSKPRLRVVHRMTDVLTTQISGVVQTMALRNGPIYADPAATLLSDDFSTSRTDLWNFNGGSTVTGGQLSIPDRTDWAGGTISKAGFNLTGVIAQVQMPRVAGSAVGSPSDSWFALDSNPVSNVNGFNFDISGGNITPSYNINGVFTSGPWSPYDPAKHQWLRFREWNGTVYWEASGNGSTWTTLWSWQPTFDITTQYLLLGTGGGTEPATLYDNLTVTYVGGPAGTGGVEPGVYGPTNKPVWKLARNKSIGAGWGSYIAADLFDDIPAGATITISMYVRAAVGEATGPVQIITDSATDTVMNLPNFTAYDGTTWQHYVQTVTLPKTWVAGLHRLRLGIGNWIEWSDATLTVSMPMQMHGRQPEPQTEPVTDPPRKLDRVFVVLR